MRGLLLATFGLFTVAALPVQAGIYNPAEPPLGPKPARDGIQPLPFSQFRGLLSDLFTIQQPGQPLGQRYAASDGPSITSCKFAISGRATGPA
jgi:hypothetical protein